MKFIFKQTDIASLVFIRIAFGILAFADVMGTWTYKHLYKDYFSVDKFHFKYYGFEWVEPLPEPFMSLFFIFLLFLTIFITIGWHYRMSCFVFAIGFIYTFLLDKVFYLNHGYLFGMLSLLMATLPANRSFSIDVFRHPKLKLKTVPYWPIFLLIFSMSIVYFYGGIAKINPDWLQAQPLKKWLANKSDMPILGPLWGHEWMPWFMSYGGLFFDLTIVFFLSCKLTRRFAFIFVLFFHTMNLTLFSIGIFPFLSTCLTLLFFAPVFPRNIMDFLHRKSKGYRWLESRYTALEKKHGVVDSGNWITYKSSQARWLKIGIVVYMAYHFLMPLRHHFYDSDVAWSEEGHRYSWRMLLRSKSGSGSFKVVDQLSCEETKIKSSEYLSRKQRRKMYSHPDMILEFAHHLRDEYQKKGQEVAVYASIRATLNSHPYYVYIDPEVDLAKVAPSVFETANWILKEGEKDVKKKKKKKKKKKFIKRKKKKEEIGDKRNKTDQEVSREKK